MTSVKQQVWKIEDNVWNHLVDTNREIVYRATFKAHEQVWIKVNPHLLMINNQLTPSSK
jgi:hypothetical protein